MTTIAVPARAVLRLNPAGWRRLCKAQGWPTMEAAARDLGVASTTIARSLAQETQPSGVLLAQVLRASRTSGLRDDEILDVVVTAPPTASVGGPL